MTQMDTERLRVRYFVTANERAPFLALVGNWPPRAAFSRLARAGVRIGWRWASSDEAEQARQSPRWMARMWPSLASFVRWHRNEYGLKAGLAICSRLRHKWGQIEMLLKQREIKRRAQMRRKARTRT